MASGVGTGQVGRALWYISAGRAEIRKEKLGAVAAGAVRIRALHGAVSRGTEALVFAGKIPESEFERMRAPFMGGAFPFPVKYGYSVVGRVEAGPSGLIGRAVFSLHPHQTVFDVPAESIVAVPDNVPVTRAVLAGNMETALNAVWDAAPAPADRISVVGGGVVGALVAWLCGHMPGSEVTLIDIDPCRAKVAAALGVGFALPDAAPGDCDLVVHASGTAAGLATALGLAGPEATVLELSWYGKGDIPVPLGEGFHSRRLKLVSSQVGQVAPSHRMRWTPHRRLEAAIHLLSDPRLDVLIAPAVPFADLPSRLADLFAPQSGVLCQRIDYPID
jgi:hypothetical protein